MIKLTFRRYRAALLAAATVLVGSTAAPASPQQSASSDQRRWWKEAVVYQIYPRSFADSNGDGVGDLNGITQHLDHLQRLGVTVVWLSPHFDSPNADNGYDIRDYRKVLAQFGTMTDFDRMLAAMKKRGMRLIIDLVVNHTSDEHRWFVEAKTGPSNPYRDYYIWRPSKAGAGSASSAPNNYPSFFGGSAWTQAKPGDDYYLHYFAVKQPDLNWDNRKVRSEVYDLMRFWLDKGVSGFRMDVIPFISKDPAFPDLTADQLQHPDRVYADGPRVHDYLKEMRREVLSKYDTMTVGEAVGVTPEKGPLFTDQTRGELDMIFRFEGVNIGRDGWRTKAWSLPALKRFYADLDTSASTTGWNTSFIGNHDKARAIDALGDGSPASAKALATMMLTLRGTPFLYQGDEIGMTNFPWTDVGQFDDIAARNLWRDQVLSGKVAATVLLPELAKTSRDNARTPMQWNARTAAGFTTGKPWLPVNPNHVTVNVSAEAADPNSVLAFYRSMLALRQKTPALIYGAYHDLDPSHPQVFAYTRIMGSDKYLVVINFSARPLSYTLPTGIAPRAVAISTAAGTGTTPSEGTLALAPWQASVYRL
ncbi:glycoside hydrolase family 13 protein [Sphingomonas melonis]|jgi:oligo-1,6-glucosidase|nr:alpha-glucosidase [Sphingomonas melonis]